MIATAAAGLTAATGVAAAAGVADLIGPPRRVAGVAAPVPLYARCSFGAYADNSPYPDVDAHYALEKLVRARLPRMTWFQDFGVPWLRTQADSAAASGHDLCISWQPAADGEPIPFGDLLAGRHDEQLASFFAAAAGYPHRVILRPFWEMNASVGTYSVTYRGPDRQVDSVEQFKSVWRDLVRLQRRVGGPRVTWFFCANGEDRGSIRMEEYWPGSDFVDEFGFDTYNDGRDTWISFYDKVSPMYRRLVSLSARLPMTLGEIGCGEDAPRGDSKSQWSRDMFRCPAFPRLTRVSLFDAKKAGDWRLDSSPESLDVFREYLPHARTGS